MRTLAQVNERFNKEYTKLQEQYRQALEKLLKEHSLDNGVINTFDGKEGVLVVERDPYRWSGYALKFYPITKAGKFSKKALDCYYLQNFKPKLLSSELQLERGAIP